MPTKRTANDVNHDLHERVRNIENKLLGNSNSILERLARLETNQEHIKELIQQYYDESLAERDKIMEKTAVVVQKKVEEISGLLQEQVSAQLRSNRYQIWGVILAIIGLVASQFLIK